MSDERDKLASALEHILSKYEGAEDDPVWQEAKKTLALMKPKPMFLPLGSIPRHAEEQSRDR